MEAITQEKVQKDSRDDHFWLTVWTYGIWVALFLTLFVATFFLPPSQEGNYKDHLCVAFLFAIPPILHLIGLYALFKEI